MSARLRNGILIQWGVLLLALFSLGGIIIHNLYRAHTEVLSTERLHLLSQARVISENLGRQLEGTDRALLGIRDELAALPENQRYSSDQNRRLTALEEAIPGIRTFLVVDSAGFVRLSNRRELVGVDVRGREYFQSARRRPDPSALYLSEPFKTILGAWAMNLTRVIPGENGEFGGIVVATLDADYFRTLLGSVNYAPDMRAAVMHGDGMQFLMMPEGAGQAGKNLARPGSLFTRHRSGGRVEEVLTGTAYTTGDERIVALRTIKPVALPLDKPLVVAVGRNLAAISANWRRNACIESGTLALVVLASLAALTVFQRRQRAHAREVECAYEQLKEGAERLRLATEAAGMGIWEYDLVTGRLLWDPSMFAIYGLDPAVFSSASDAWRDRVLPEDLGRAEAELRAAIQGVRPFATLFRIRRGDGEVRTIRAIAQVRHDPTGRPVRMIGTNEDITERAQAREQLRQRERDLNAVLDNMPSRIGYWDSNQRNRFCNRAYANWFSTDPEQMRGKHVREVFGEDLYERNLPYMDAVLRGEPQVFERSLLAPDGVTPRHSLAQYIPDLLDGEVQGFYVFVHDVSPIKNAENALRESEERLRTIFENAPIPIAVLGSEGDVLAVNRAAEEVLGYGREELRGEALSAFLHEDDAAGYRALLERLVSGELHRTEPRERRYRCKIGDWLWGRTVASAVRDVEGRFLFAIEMVENMTETKRLQEQLFQAHKMESMGHLAAGLAHDFNNLLMVISSSAELIGAAGREDGRIKPYLDHIDVAVGRAAKLTGRMLDYAGESPSFCEAVNLSEIAAAVVGMLKGAFPVNVALHLEPASPVPPVVADEKQLREVAISLITNAWEAIGDEAGDVSVRTSSVSVDESFSRGGYMGEPLRHGTYAVLEVADTGCGMDELTQERIFDPFFTTKFTGRGLELAAVLGIVRSHGGAIRVVSVPNKGTTFTVLLPAEDASTQTCDAEPAGLAPALSTGQDHPTGNKTGTILLVDDERELREVTRIILEKLGFEVLTAYDGLEGLRVFREHADQISAVLLDMTMPRMGGKEVLREIQRLRPRMPVILASGYSTDRATKGIDENPPAAFLQKPFHASELEQTIRVVLNATG